MKVKHISREEFDEFVTKSLYNDYFQSSMYRTFLKKNKLKTRLVGFYEAGELKAAILIAYKRVFFSYALGYAPRGLVIDYHDVELLNKVLKALKKYLISQRFMTFKLDPPLVILKRNKYGKALFMFDKSKEVLRTFKRNGFVHKGFNKYFENMNPRFEAVVKMDKSTDEFFKIIAKNVRNKLRKATKYGLVVYKDNKYDFNKFYPVLKGFKNLPLSYYKTMQYAFGDNLEIYYAKLNTIEYVENSRVLYEKELEINDYLTKIIQSSGYKGKNMELILNKKMQSDKVLSSYKNYMVEATNLLRKYPEGLIVGVTVTLKYNGTLYLIAENFNRRYNNLCANYLTKWKIIEKYSATDELKYFNLGAISGEFEREKNKYKGLNEMKFGYKAKAHEYLGEFSIILSPRTYKLYQTFGKKKKS